MEIYLDEILYHSVLKHLSTSKHDVQYWLLIILFNTSSQTDFVPAVIFSLVTVGLL